MAMRIITVEKLKDCVEDRLGRKQLLIKDENNVKIVDAYTDTVNCCISRDSISNFDDSQPFLKFRDQVSSGISMSNDFISAEELKPYSYLLD